MAITPLRKIQRLTLSVVMFLGLVAPLQAVVLDSESRAEVVLDDGTTVTLYARAGSRGRTTNEYYFLPFNLHLAQRPDKTPEFLFMEYIAEKRADSGGIGGALMHFLVTWGPTPDQFSELETKLGKTKPGAKLKGAVPLEIDSEAGSFKVVSATMTNEKLTPNQVTSGKAPALPDGRAAAAANLNPEGAQLMHATFDGTTSITDLSLVFDYTYLLKEPAARGYIEIDWSRIESESESLEAEYKKWKSGTRTSKTKILGITVHKSSKPTYSRSYKEIRNEYEFMREQNIVKVHFEALRDGESVQKMQDAFFQFFLNMTAEASEPEDGVPPQPSEQEKQQSPNIRYGNSYKYKQSFLKRVNQRKTQRLELNADVAVRYPIQLVGNLVTWYGTVKNSDCCIKKVFLNDPFYSHRDINFILDLDAKDIFDEVINYVTINVRKERSSGRPFEDRITIDQNYLKEHGVNASLTYARGDDTSGDLYQYQALWSLRGGEVWPTQPRWQEGSWEALSLAPPVEARVVEVEADLNELEASDITRVTVQIHYPQLGHEKEANIHISPSRDKNFVESKVFTDKNAPGYVYRLVLNHKRDGKLVLPWQAKVSDNYIYVNIPPDLLEEGSDLNNKAKEEAKDVGKSAKEKVLDQFEELMGGGA